MLHDRAAGDGLDAVASEAVETLELGEDGRASAAVHLTMAEGSEMIMVLVPVAHAEVHLRDVLVAQMTDP